MKRVILGLTLLSFSTIVSALEPFKPSDKKTTIGEERVERRIVVNTSQHFFDGCGEPGFHLAEEEENGKHTFFLYCGSANGTKEYIVIKETGI